MSMFNKESMFVRDNHRLLLENDRLRAEVASLKEENARLKGMPLSSDAARAVIYGEAIDRLNAQIARNVSEIIDLTQQLATANGRVELLKTSGEALLRALSFYEIARTAQRDQLQSAAQQLTEAESNLAAALSDLPYEVPSFEELHSEADKEKS